MNFSGREEFCNALKVSIERILNIHTTVTTFVHNGRTFINVRVKYKSKGKSIHTAENYGPSIYSYTEKDRVVNQFTKKFSSDASYYFGSNWSLPAASLHQLSINSYTK